jgi:hypothetical protein
MTFTRTRNIAFGLWLFAIAMHAAWAFTIPEPVDWDPAYYRTIARHIASGDGAVDGALWNLLWLPPSLPYPADVHWMPLPSRVLVPGVLLWPAHGDQLVTVLLGGTWAPLAFALAGRLKATEPIAILAGVLAATGLCFARFLSTPDCFALYGAVGGLATLLLADQRPLALAVVCGVAALVRNDGFLLGPCLALGLEPASKRLFGWENALAAAPGPLAFIAWNLRNAAIVGAGYAAMRTATANVIDTENLVGLTLGNAPHLTIGDRVRFFVSEGLPNAGLIWLIALPFPSVAIVVRRERWIRGVQAYWFVMPILTQLLAPGVAASGSIFRSTAGMFPVACALAAVALGDLGAWGQRVRGYHPAFFPGLFTLVIIAGSLSLASGGVGGTSPLASTVCGEVAALPAGAPIFTVHPLLMEAHCGRPAVVLIKGMTPAQAADLAARYGVHYALARPESDGYAPSPRRSDIAELLPTWVEIAPLVYADPVTASASGTP